MSKRRNSLFVPPEPQAVTVIRYGPDGQVEATYTSTPVTTRRARDFEPDVVLRRYRLIATEETGEECFAGYARTAPEAARLCAEWMEAHPEHRGVRSEPVD